MLGLTCSNLIRMFIGWHIFLENPTKKMLLMPIEPWEGVKLVMILMKACSKLCSKPWEGMFSFFVFSVSCHFVLNVGFFSFEIGVVWASFSSYQWDYGYCWRSKTRTLQIPFSVQGLAIVNTFKCTIQKRFCIACSDSCFKF